MTISSALSQRWDAARLWQRMAAAALLGAVAAFGNAPWNAWPLSIVALAVIYGTFRHTTRARDAALLGCVAGTGYFMVALSWIIEPFLVDPVRHGWMAPFAVTLLSFYLAWYWAGAFALARALGGGPSAFAGAFVFGEGTRALFFTGFGWAQVGHVLIDTPLLHYASFGGAMVLLLMVWAVAMALWHLVARQGGVMGPAAVLIGVGVLYAFAPFLRPDASPDEGAPVVRVVQPNAPQHEKWDPEKMSVFFDRQLRFTGAQGTRGRPDLVVWPETAIPYLLSDAPPVLETIAAEARGAQVVLGLRRYDGPRIYNTLIAMDADGLVGSLYDKHHLVPFGEFVPFGDLMARFGIGGLASENGLGFSSGPGPGVVDLGKLGRAAPLICYEGIFARNLLNMPTRADMILMITNDAWFGNVSGPYQHLAQGRLRAVEQGLPMVRSANTGISAIVDASGQVVASIPLGEAGFADAALPPPLPPTLYSRTGDWPAYALAVLLLIWSPLRRRVLSQVKN